MGYTEFGEFFRILRIKNHEVLADAKKFLGVSTAFISAVECGKKKVPEDWIDKIVNHYSLNDNSRQELIDSIEKSKNCIELNISLASSEKKSFALQFQRSFKDLDEESMKEIQKILDNINLDNNGL